MGRIVTFAARRGSVIRSADRETAPPDRPASAAQPDRPAPAAQPEPVA